MKQREIAVVCLYSEEGAELARIIQSSFLIFLEKELQPVFEGAPCT